MYIIIIHHNNHREIVLNKHQSNFFAPRTISFHKYPSPSSQTWTQNTIKCKRLMNTYHVYSRFHIDEANSLFCQIECYMVASHISTDSFWFINRHYFITTRKCKPRSMPSHFIRDKLNDRSLLSAIVT